MRDAIIGFLLAQNPRGWRAHALMLKSAEENGLVYEASIPSRKAVVESIGDTGLLDLLEHTFWELSKRAEKRPEMWDPAARWLAKLGDPSPALDEISDRVEARLASRQDRT
jgi:hypothetical protein